MYITRYTTNCRIARSTRGCPCGAHTPRVTRGAHRQYSLDSPIGAIGPDLDSAGTCHRRKSAIGAIGTIGVSIGAPSEHYRSTIGDHYRTIGHPLRRAAAAETDAAAVDLEGWRECLAYARYDELAPDLRAACYYADDARLASLRHPAVLSRVTSAHLDPLPSPPPPGLIPAGATTFEDGLWPWAVERILVFQRELQAYLRWMLVPQRRYKYLARLKH